MRGQAEWARTSVVTSLPDVSEVGMSLPTWREWFTDAAALVIARTPADCAAIFFQTDIKAEGTWVDKGYLVQRAAEREGAALLWHKVVCRRSPGTVTFGRPAWAHLLCFSRGVRELPGQASADVLPELGEMTWSRGMGLSALQFSVRWLQARTPATTHPGPLLRGGQHARRRQRAGIGGGRRGAQPPPRGAGATIDCPRQRRGEADVGAAPASGRRRRGPTRGVSPRPKRWAKSPKRAGVVLVALRPSTEWTFPSLSDCLRPDPSLPRRVERAPHLPRGVAPSPVAMLDCFLRYAGA